MQNNSDRPRAIPTKQAENEAFVVTRWDFAPGAETGRHVHAMDYVVVPLTTGTLTIEAADGQITQSPLTNGVSYARYAGVDHNVINDNDSPFSFIEIEKKTT
ncbi:cupin domain-containing protein [Candidatus Puniceispirillum sp.]|uniref:cupin domain-containing protein n=1 Tax=Candidatus Puniceispirillum sp. TaxID=2026719 RepID=UPI003F6A2890